MRRSMFLLAAAVCLIAVAADVGGQPGSGGAPVQSGQPGRGKKGAKGGAGAFPVSPDIINEQADQLFQRLDKNGDGKLNQDEMPAQLRANLDRFDKNRDGLIDQNEFRAYLLARVTGELEADGGGQAGGPDRPGGAAPDQDGGGPGQPGGKKGGGFGGGFGPGGGPGGFGGGGAFAQPRPAHIATWEYRVVDRQSLDSMGKKDGLQGGLNLIGAEGWELVAIEAHSFSGGGFNRPMPMAEYIFRRPGTPKLRTDAKPSADAAPKQKTEERAEFRMFRLKHTDAIEVAGMIEQLMRSGKQDPMRIVADPHTNSLLVRGSPQTQVDVEMLVRFLDVQAEKSSEPRKKSAFGPGFGK